MGYFDTFEFSTCTSKTHVGEFSYTDGAGIYQGRLGSGTKIEDSGTVNRPASIPNLYCSHLNGRLYWRREEEGVCRNDDLQFLL